MTPGLRPRCVAVDVGVRCPDDAINGWLLCAHHATLPGPLTTRATSLTPAAGQRPEDWAGDWSEALATLFLGDHDDAHLFRRVRVALLAAYEFGRRGEVPWRGELPFIELPTGEPR